MHVRGVQAPGDWSHKVQQSDDPSHGNLDQASDDRLHFPVSTRKSRVTEQEASFSEDYYRVRQREQHASSSSGRNESHNPNVQGSADRLQSKTCENVANLLSTGVKLVPNLVTRVEENLKKTFGKPNFTNFPVNTATWFFRARLHVGIIPSEQIHRNLHQRLSELFLLEYAGHTEHLDWKYS